MSAATRSVSDIVRDALQQELKTLLSRCTEAQTAFFHSLYPGGIESLSEDKLRNAIPLCQRTIARNEGAI
ncbi:hypothetical protein [Phyllobacterium brassicacearum]|nr:hypothetical protein [Phyllobacterium brassicacearum]TDQ19914.1 hypothetical protein DEV91_124109 [Phyllobacterium brassicacearum]